MSINNINTRGPLDAQQKANLATAREVKSNVLKTAKRFKALDETSSDMAAGRKDTVFVGETEKADLPHSTGNMLARLAVGALAPKEPELKASGHAKVKDGRIETVDLTTKDASGKESALQYRTLEDGSEIYHGPTADGYAVVRENKDGTLMMTTSDKPSLDTYWDASNWDSAPQTSPEEQTKPATFEETLRNLASGQQAEGTATNTARDEAVKPKAPGFLSSFGAQETGVPNVDEVKQKGGEFAQSVSDGFKDASEKAEVKAKETTQSLKDWSQTDTGQKVGDLLFGKLNPWKKKG